MASAPASAGRGRARLHAADRRDIEIVAAFLLQLQAHETLFEVYKAEGLTEEEADGRWVDWLLNSETGGSLNDDPRGLARQDHAKLTELATARPCASRWARDFN
jgi:hypothetical protein